MSHPDSFQFSRRALLCAGCFAPLAAITRSASTQPAWQPMLAQPWQASLNPADYLVSEKLDGVRALWDGDTLRFRSGRAIAAPAWLLDGLPREALDGELWMGRHRFDALSGVVRKEVPVEAEWRQVRYMVFDLPRMPGPFVQRAARI